MRDNVIARLSGQIGEERVSGWVAIDQPMIDRFADLTGDRQYIHVDPEMAAYTPFGSTIAHGFLTLSLMPRFMEMVELNEIPGTRMTVNCGTNYLRFINPVRSGASIRGRMALKSVEARGTDRLHLIYTLTVDIEGEDRPALVADWITQAYL